MMNDSGRHNVDYPKAGWRSQNVSCRRSLLSVASASVDASLVRTGSRSDRVSSLDFRVFGVIRGYGFGYWLIALRISHETHELHEAETRSLPFPVLTSLLSPNFANQKKGGRDGPPSEKQNEH
jgi:hypothetical protein